MTRNMDNRVEVTAPIYDNNLKKIIIDLMDLQFKDTVRLDLLMRIATQSHLGRSGR